MPKSTKQNQAHEDELAKLTEDLQRVQADFINYRRRVDEDRKALIETTKAATVTRLLPVVDNIELATKHVPAELADNKWAQGIIGLNKSLGKSLVELGLTRINAEAGTVFDPHLHEAVMMDETSQGDEEVIAEELRTGYQLGTQVVRHSMVKVTRQPTPPERKPEKVVEQQLESEPEEQTQVDY